jgi:hypothetical protein
VGIWFRTLFTSIWAYLSQPDFHTNFFANVASDVLLAIFLTFIIARLSQRRAEKHRVQQILGLLRTEVELNTVRAREYARAIRKYPEIDLSTLFPLRFTRGVWNAFKESGFLQQVESVRLIYLLLRMNEATLAANKNVRRFELAVLEPDPNKNLERLRSTAIANSETLLELLEPTLELLNQLKLPSFDPKEVELFEEATEVAKSELTETEE